MSADRVRESVEGGVLTLTLNRPDKRNAIDRLMVEALHAGLERAELDAQVRVVVVRGAGKDFCAGADLKELLESVDLTPEENAAAAGRLGEIFVRIRELPKPVVAVVEGRALAGGCGLATACDIVLAHPDASFGYPEVKRGFVPALVIAMLQRAVGEKAALELVITGRVVSAVEAERLRLISRVLDGDAFEEAVGTVLGDLVASSPSALALIKRQFYEIEGRSFKDAIVLGANLNAVARVTPDFKEAVAKFLGK